MSRDVEARGSVWAQRRPARPRFFSRAGGLECGFPGADQINTGGGALAFSDLILRSPPKAGVSKDGLMVRDAPLTRRSSP